MKTYSNTAASRHQSNWVISQSQDNLGFYILELAPIVRTRLVRMGGVQNKEFTELVSSPSRYLRVPTISGTLRSEQACPSSLVSARPASEQMRDWLDFKRNLWSETTTSSGGPAEESAHNHLFAGFGLNLQDNS